MLPTARRLKSAIISRAQLWEFLLEVGAARRQGSIYLSLYRELDWEDEFEAERLSVRQYLAGLGLAVHLVLIDLGLPAPCVSRVLACYGTEDTEDLVLSELHQAQAELFSRPSSSSRVRFVELI